MATHAIWIPVEILEHIFFYLPERDLIRYTRTCKAFIETITCSNLLLQKLYISAAPTMSPIVALDWNPCLFDPALNVRVNRYFFE